MSASQNPQRKLSHLPNLLGGLDYLINNAGAPARNCRCSDTRVLEEDAGCEFVECILDDQGRSFRTGRTPRLSSQYGVSKRICETFGQGSGAPGEGQRDSTRNGNSPWECSFGDQEEDARTAVPLQRVGQTDEYNELIAFLAAGAPYITGQIIVADGGVQLLE
ncbi:SDR family oxidoreductase [Mesorhizobium sp. Cs1299R1N1]|uniref:SDR family oxidoreductase n=1 Tax=Mesorhizobium sp. Cs1299R1N1 TaxID=3015172 RepID=UPI003FA5E5D2